MLTNVWKRNSMTQGDFFLPSLLLRNCMLFINLIKLRQSKMHFDGKQIYICNGKNQI